MCVGSTGVWATWRSRSLLQLTQGDLPGSARAAVAPRTKGQSAMARQKSEDREVVQARRKPGVTREVEPRAGAKAIPVDEEPK
jgi:hypothetical protein